MDWFYARDGQPHGPVPQMEIDWLIQSGELAPDAPAGKDVGEP